MDARVLLSLMGQRQSPSLFMSALHLVTIYTSSFPSPPDWSILFIYFYCAIDFLPDIDKARKKRKTKERLRRLPSPQVCHSPPQQSRPHTGELCIKTRQ